MSGLAIIHPDRHQSAAAAYALLIGLRIGLADPCTGQAAQQATCRRTDAGPGERSDQPARRNDRADPWDRQRTNAGQQPCTAT